MDLQQTLEEVFPESTGAAQLEQLGLFTLIFAMENDPEPLTAARVAERTGLPRSHVDQLVRKLIALNVVSRTRAPGPGGVRALRLRIKHSAASRKLLAAIEEGAIRKPSR